MRQTYTELCIAELQNSQKWEVMGGFIEETEKRDAALPKPYDLSSPPSNTQTAVTCVQ